MIATLDVSPDLSFPAEAVTEAFGILAVRRSGKSNTAVVMAECMFDIGIPWVAVDPKGDWWGIRSAADGKGPGLPVLVFGGEHGDVPLEPTAGNLIADLIVDQRITCVLDVSEMSKADQRRFLLDFFTRLYKRNREPLHVFLEEADEYIPQKVMGEMAKLVGAAETLVKRGGFHGIGVTLITQRSAALNKDVLSQIGTLIAMRTGSPQDRKAVLGWVEQHAMGKEAVDSLPKLANGQAWVFSPEWLELLKKVQFRRRRTFDSGATPKLNRKRTAPVTVADVDLAAIKEAMAETIERAKESDPKELRARIRRLEAELHESRAEQPEPVTITETINVVPSAVMAAIQGIIDAGNVLVDVAKDLDAHIDEPTPQPARSQPRATPRAPQRPAPPEPPRAAPAPTGKRTASQKILDALGWLLSVGIDPVDRTQLALLAGASPKSSAYGNNLGALRTDGMITYPSPGKVGLTYDGRAQAIVPDAPPTTDDLQARILSQVKGAKARILSQLIAIYPDSFDRTDLAEAAGASPASSAYGNNLGALRSLGLIDYPEPGMVMALPVLFLEGR